MSRARDIANLGTQAGSGLDASDITSGALGASVTGGAGLAVSTATTTALNDKAPKASPTFTGTVSTNQSDPVVNIMTGNAVINTDSSLFINIDSDNAGSPDRSFNISHDEAGSGGSNLLFKVQENGNVGIGCDPDQIFHIYKSGTNTGFRIENDTNGADFLIQAGTVGGLAFYDMDNSTYRMLIGGSGNVGIGSPAISPNLPLGKLHVASGETGGSVSNNADELVVESSSHGGISILTGTNAVGNIYFCDNENVNDGFISYEQTARLLKFGTAAVQRMIIDSSGNVGIGQTSPSSGNGANTFLHIGNDTTPQSSLIIEENGSKWELKASESIYLLSGTTNYFSIRENNGYVTFPNSTQRVAIGHGDPDVNLHIQAADQNVTCRVAYSGTYYTNYGYHTINTVGNSLRLSTDGSERVKIESNGHVGIGCTPSARLHLHEGAADVVLMFGDAGGRKTHTIQCNNSTGGHDGHHLVVKSGRGTDNNSSCNSGSLTLEAAEGVGNCAASAMMFKQDGAERIKILDGKIGINCTAGAKLESFSSDAVTQIVSTGSNSPTNLSGSGVLCLKAKYNRVQDRGPFIGFFISNNTGAQVLEDMGTMGFFASTNTSVRKAYFAISMRNVGHYQAFRINEDFSLTAASTNDISDGRLKENIVTISNGLDKINTLSGKTFTWKPEAHLQTGTQYGLISQDVEAVLPDLVSNNGGLRLIDTATDEIVDQEDGHMAGENGIEHAKNVKLTSVIPILVEAVKELSAKVTVLEAA